jgi:hypothetical protein
MMGTESETSKNATKVRAGVMSMLEREQEEVETRDEYKA